MAWAPVWKKVVAPVKSGADWRPQPGGIHGKQIKYGNQAERKPGSSSGAPARNTRCRSKITTLPD